MEPRIDTIYPRRLKINCQIKSRSTAFTLITEKHLGLLVTLICPKLFGYCYQLIVLFNLSIFQSFEGGQADEQTDGRMEGRYQVHYLPRFVVDKNNHISFIFCNATVYKFLDLHPIT